MATASKARLLTIGTVSGLLKDEFPDISISKIRYLEAIASSPKRTWKGSRRSCGCSATSSCRSA